MPAAVDPSHHPFVKVLQRPHESASSVSRRPAPKPGQCSGLDLSTIDLLLLSQRDRGLAYAKRRRELLDARSCTSELDNLTTDLRRVPAGHLVSPNYRRF
jgi:hypothetical protein